MTTRRLISDRQFAHMKDALTAYRDTHNTSFAEMAEQCNRGHGTLATLVRPHYKTPPTMRLAKSLMQGLGMTEEELLGLWPATLPAEAPPRVGIVPPTHWDFPGEPPVSQSLSPDMLRLILETLQVIAGLMTAERRDRLAAIGKVDPELGGICP